MMTPCRLPKNRRGGNTTELWEPSRGTIAQKPADQRAGGISYGKVFFAAPPVAGRTLREPQDCSTQRAPRLSRESAPWLSRENEPVQPPGQPSCRGGSSWLALETRL